jgi:hypothetical protein
VSLIDLVARRAEGYRHGEEVPFDPDWGSDREQLWLLLGEAENIQRAARELVEALKADFARTLSENESVRMGDKIWKVGSKSSSRIIDVEGFIEWLGDDWPLIVPLSPSTGDKLKVQGLRAVCERRGLAYQTVRDTFAPVEWSDELELKAIPLAQAPKYTQGLAHGESTYRGKQ